MFIISTIAACASLGATIVGTVVGAGIGLVAGIAEAEEFGEGACA